MIKERLVYYKPITPSLRHTILVDKSQLNKTYNNRQLTSPYKGDVGRNSKGLILIRHKINATKKKYRLLDYYYNQIEIPGFILSVEYDPMRSSYINLVRYDNGFVTYKLNTYGIGKGDSIKTTKHVRFDNGYSSELKFIPEGSYVHNLELRPDRGGSIARSAGTHCTLLTKNNKYAIIKLPSKKIIHLNIHCKATLGITSNILHRDQHLGKAGRSLKLGKRPTVRGVAMNPIDHPHGGGEGKKSNKKESYNFTGRVIKGMRTQRKYKHKIQVNKLNKIKI